MDSKSPWQSKTIWANLIMGALPLIPGVGALVSAHPEAAAAAMGLLNAILRGFTTQPISTKGNQ